MSGKTELKIFDDHPPQVVIESAYFEDIYPTSSLDESNSVIEFVIPGSNVDYLDLNDTLLSVQLKVLKMDGTNIKEEYEAANFFLHALFKDVSLYLNDVLIEGGTTLYPYKAAIDTMLNFDTQTMKNQLVCQGISDEKDWRMKLISASKVCELIGPLRLDFFNHPKYLIPGVSARIRLTRHDKTFPIKLITDSTADAAVMEKRKHDFKIVLTKAHLYVRRVKVHPMVLRAHNLGLETKNALYPYTQTKIISFAIPKDTTSFTKDNIFTLSQLPKLVVVGVVKGTAYSGATVRRAISFSSNLGLTSISLLRNGQSLPYRQGYEVDHAKGIYKDAYVRAVLQNMNLINTNNNCMITPEGFNDGYQQLFVFNLTPDFDLKECQPISDSNLRLDLSFSGGAKEAINVIAYACYDVTLQITKNRDIIRHAHT
jgi:hypothetical protein